MRALSPVAKRRRRSAIRSTYRSLMTSFSITPLNKRRIYQHCSLATHREVCVRHQPMYRSKLEFGVIILWREVCINTDEGFGAGFLWTRWRYHPCRLARDGKASTDKDAQTSNTAASAMKITALDRLRPDESDRRVPQSHHECGQVQRQGDRVGAIGFLASVMSKDATRKTPSMSGTTGL